MSTVTLKTWVPIGLLGSAIMATVGVVKYVDTPNAALNERQVRVEGELRLLQADVLRVKADIMRLETEALTRRVKEDERWEVVLKELTAIKTKLEVMR